MGYDLSRYRYRIDQDDNLTWVDERWLAFARENGAPELNASRLLRRSLWDFIAGTRVRELYEHLHRRVRSDGEPAIVAFRCDSPTLLRFMRLTISADKGDSLLYSSVIVSVEARQRLPLLEADHPRSDAVVTTCSFCKLALLEPIGWIELREVNQRLRIDQSPRLPRLRYSVCPKCESQITPS